MLSEDLQPCSHTLMLSEGPTYTMLSVSYHALTLLEVPNHALRGSYHAVSMCHGLTRFYHALRVSYQLPCYQRTLPCSQRGPYHAAKHERA